jgi:hypothetical protein
MNEVNSMGVHEIGNPTGAADPSNTDEIGLSEFKFLNDVEEGGENGKVSAGGTPGRVVSLELLLGEFLGGLRRFVVGHRTGVPFLEGWGLRIQARN